MRDGYCDVRELGAKGDGIADDTSVIQKAIDAAAEIGGTVIIPPGIFTTTTLKMRPHVGLQGYPTWSFQDSGGSILRLADPNAPCLLDVTGAPGATINGLSLEGGGLGKDVHGIWLNKPYFGKEEDTLLVERCKIARFTGDGIRLDHVWLFTVRHTSIFENEGDGLRVWGWDGFVLDNWFSCNHGAGYEARDESGAITMTANRVEVNRQGSIVIRGGGGYNICGNYMNCPGGPGIDLGCNSLDHGCRDMVVTGNMLRLSGMPRWRKLSEDERSHIRLEKCWGLTLTSNVLRAGRGDDAKDEFSPDYGIVCSRLENTVIKDNVYHTGVLKQWLVDRGGHGEGVVIRDNVGSLFFIEPATAGGKTRREPSHGGVE